MPLVEPLLPTHIFEFIKPSKYQDEVSRELMEIAGLLSEASQQDLRLRSENCSNDLALASQGTYLADALVLLYPLPVDKEFRVLNLELYPGAGSDRELAAACLRQRIFAAFLIEALCNIRVHDQKGARKALNSAIESYEQSKPKIDKLKALESIGLVKALLDELENKLSRIEPCF